MGSLFLGSGLRGKGPEAEVLWSRKSSVRHRPQRRGRQAAILSWNPRRGFSWWWGQGLLLHKNWLCHRALGKWGKLGTLARHGPNSPLGSGDPRKLNHLCSMTPLPSEGSAPPVPRQPPKMNPGWLETSWARVPSSLKEELQSSWTQETTREPRPSKGTNAAWK